MEAYKPKHESSSIVHHISVFGTSLTHKRSVHAEKSVGFMIRQLLIAFLCLPGVEKLFWRSETLEQKMIFKVHFLESSRL